MIACEIECDQCMVRFTATEFMGIEHVDRIRNDAHRQGWWCDGSDLCPKCWKEALQKKESLKK